jgi:DNA-binding response OmpR family regulator
MVQTASKDILVIDDDKDVCDILRARFSQFNFSVRTALDGQEAFKMVLEKRPDCILLDIRMPNLDGLTFLRKVRSYRSDADSRENEIRNIPVIVLTGTGKTMKPLFDLEAISDYVEKPFDADDLKTRVEKALHS